MFLSEVSFGGESPEYRKSRDELLEAEFALIEQCERVAELRRRLPMARPVETDYVFREGPADLGRNQPADFFDTRLSALFADGADSLIVAHLMFGPGNALPCPMCSMWLDGYNAVVPHLEQHAGFAVVAKAEIGKLREFARGRGWSRLRLLSSHDNSFNRDFRVEGEDGTQRPGVSVFRRGGDGAIQHFYTSEAILRRSRGIDLLSPVWNFLDLLPAGRGDWYPAHDYMPGPGR
ncbi:MAG: DUF899 family protein [Alphaproteobacteria bacterium]|nr:DUF899 family protein [Alphaproteobacteria bacterium]